MANEHKSIRHTIDQAIVGRNSNFLTLTSAQEEELGGVEYRALSILLKIVIGYWVFFQLLAIVITLPWLAVGHEAAKFRAVFNAPDGTSVAWYVIWITCSSFTNGGMRSVSMVSNAKSLKVVHSTSTLNLCPSCALPSLIDSGFTVFQDAYLLIFVCSVLILAGNTAFPIFLRLAIWALSKLAPRLGRTKEVLTFLLDHPRRCFVYLFPARQTWYLFGTILVLNMISWVAFMILNIGIPEFEKIPVGTVRNLFIHSSSKKSGGEQGLLVCTRTDVEVFSLQRIVDGLLQSLSVRAAGFSIVSISALAPALQVLYIIMVRDVFFSSRNNPLTKQPC